MPAGLILVYPVVHPNGPEASAEVDLGIAARAAREQLRRVGRGSARPPRVRRARAGRRIPADPRRRLRERRPAPLGRGVRASARGCRHRGRTCIWRPVPATVTSTSPPTRPRCRRSRRSPSGSAPAHDHVHQPDPRRRPARPGGHQSRRRVLDDVLVVRSGAGSSALSLDRPRELDVRDARRCRTRSATRSRSTSPSTTAASSSTSRSSRRRGRR